MWYYIYRKTSSGSFEEIGRTRYLQDGLAIYERWHAAYITNGDQTLLSKNIEES